MACWIALLGGCASSVRTEPSAATLPPESVAAGAVEAEAAGETPPALNAGTTSACGIEPLTMRLSAAGYMLDFRYRVTDPEKAADFLTRAARPQLIDQESGATFLVPSPPKVGSLRQVPQQPSADRTYFMLFANPGRQIQPGTRVTVVVGDSRVENLIVE